MAALVGVKLQKLELHQGHGVPERLQDLKAQCKPVPKGQGRAHLNNIN